ncbi:MAG: putative selenate reductase subunit YgfK [Anaerolineales bacterium]|nr:putative selenate reductase subunit YgfK [Anaerolineales bacterium]
MSDVVQPISFRHQLTWILQEYKTSASVFGISEEHFYRKVDDSALSIFGEICETPLGPAAGPHTQVSQNLVAAYLTGGRFFELKTVQIMDELEIEKPCIDAEQETYNTEWSTELTVQQAFDEYVKGWFLVHIVNAMFGLSRLNERGFIFNMSVGYDLKGIQSPKIDAFIENLKDASGTAVFKECKAILAAAIEAGEIPNLSDPAFADRISPRISNSITLSTMHGTPPEDQEVICRYLISEKKLHTFVKLNPTLLGYDFVQTVFHEMGYDNLQLKEETFSHDMQYPDAVAMLHSLRAHAGAEGFEFGMKLSNTLAVVNNRGALPTDEMYMSGRALYPLTINLARRLAEEFEGNLPISYSGGADTFNVVELLRAGLKPITVATTLLKPGGYNRLNQLAQLVEKEGSAFARQSVDLDALARTAEAARQNPRYKKTPRSALTMKINQPLEKLDCFVAPCTLGCPINQDIPEYIRLIGEERYDEAFRLITAKNPLPFITGYICDHKCQLKCVRNDYEDPVLIRDLKRIAAERGFEAVLAGIPSGETTRKARVAVIGAGPAGLSAGCFLAREGFPVTIFDKTDRPGGMVAHGIPGFRYPDSALARDLALIERSGVTFEMNCDPGLSIAGLKADGFTYIVLAIGAWKSRQLDMEGDQNKVRGAIEFLQAFRRDPGNVSLGKHIAVIGGGNSAMDSARAAMRVAGVEDVTICYRRTVKQMPADREELENAARDGVVFRELLSPLSLRNGMLTCQVMELGKVDASGRKRPVPVDGKTESFPADTVLAAVGELVDYDMLEANQVEVDDRGGIRVGPYNETSLENVFIAGDALHGPATVVEAIADARVTADGILSKESILAKKVDASAIAFDDAVRAEAVTVKKARIVPHIASEDFDLDYRLETARCLECSFICNKCVEVCPNRANAAIAVDSLGLHDRTQVLHLDALCNECGNCAVFCPYQGAPYIDKFTLFWDESSFVASRTDGYVMAAADELILRLAGKHYNCRLKAGKIVSTAPDLPDTHEAQALVALIEAVADRYGYLLAG